MAENRCQVIHSFFHNCCSLLWGKSRSFIIRYHSFYAAHQEGAYTYLMSEKDREMLPWLKLFQQYDLYSKSPEPLDIAALKPYYEELVAEFFPEKLDW